MMVPVIMSIPSPSISEFSIGPLTIHIYALCLMAGMVVAWWLGRKRWMARGGLGETFESIAIVAIPAGIVGARIYHVATHWEDYFGEGQNPLSALYIWEGGIAIFGAVTGGALGAALGGADRVRGAMRVGLGGAAALLVTYLLGALVGTAV